MMRPFACFVARRMADPLIGDDLRELLARWVIAYEKKMGRRKRNQIADDLGLSASQLSNILNYERLKEKTGKPPAIGLDTLVKLHTAIPASMDRMVRHEPDELEGERPPNPATASPAAHAPRRRKLGGGQNRET